MAWGPDFIAVDAGSTYPGPHYRGSGEMLVSDFGIKRELTELICAARQAKIPLIVGSAGGAGARSHVDTKVKLVREVARECGLSFRLSWIYSDIPREVVSAAIERGDVQDFEAGFDLSVEAVMDSSTLVAQMGHEPIVAALEQGRSEEHTSELPSLQRISYAVFCFQKKKTKRD